MKPDLAPGILTIFGITGDLARQKLLPALYDLAHDGLLPTDSKIVGITRSGISVDEIIERIVEQVEDGGRNECDNKIIDWLRQAITIVTMQQDKDSEYDRLKSVLDGIEDDLSVCMNRLFYLAIPTSAFETVTTRLGSQGLNNGCQHGKMESRLLVEKPLGSDETSANELIDILRSAFDEQQIYRIDHYLAKETVQNLLAFRFENPLFSSSWDNHHVAQIMITAAETNDVSDRATFYEQTGALRDVVQSHLLQLLSLVTMERPDSLSAEDIHQAKTELLKQIQTPTPEQMTTRTMRGQYDGYRLDVDNPDSQVETYAGLVLSADNDRWRDVPLLLRTGKDMAEKVTEITLVYRDNAHTDNRNSLTIRIQPDEGIVLDLRIKKPGYSSDIEPVQMSFCYGEVMDGPHPDAYERVLVDALRGDKTLFATSEEVLASWRIIDPIVAAWADDEVPLEPYDPGSWGPAAAQSLAEENGGDWLTAKLRVCEIDHNH